MPEAEGTARWLRPTAGADADVDVHAATRQSPARAAASRNPFTM
jgi:hypothetical protein